MEGETTIAQVEDLLGSPTEKAHENGRLRYDYNSQSLTRDIVTELLIGWQFLDNHVLTLCERGRTSCTTYKGKADEDAKSLRIYFKKGIVDDAYILNL